MNPRPGAVFLDRDGVLNRALLRQGVPHPPTTVNEVELLPGAQEACRRLAAAGYRLVVVTNQPDVARGNQSLEDVQLINEWLQARLPIDAWEVCLHDDADACTCRKPKPGLLFQAADRLNIDLTKSFMVGDRWRDVEAGLAAGCQTVFLDYGYAERQPRDQHRSAANLPDAAAWILAETARGERK